MAINDTIADYVRASLLGCSAFDALISKQRLDEIHRIASLLPGALTEFFGFECPLATGEPIADFLVCAGVVEGGREVLAGANPMAVLPAAFEEHWIWRRIAAFARAWNDPQSPLHETVAGMWLEFDMDEQPPAVPVPSVFIGSDHLRLNEGPAGDSEEMPSHCAWLTGTAMPLLNGASENAARDRMIARSVNALPASARIFQFGWMLSRPGAPARLCIRGISPDEIVEYLRAIGRRGALVDLEVQLAILSEQAGRIDLDLDVAEEVSPKVGLECYPKAGAAASAQLVNWLAQHGYCSDSKAAALKSWAGLAHEKRWSGEWPGGLLAASSFLRGRAHSVFVRWLHHVKIVYEPGQAPRAKAYLGARHVWLDPAVVKSAVGNAGREAIITETKSLPNIEEEIPCKS